MRVDLLGPIRLTVDGEPIAFKSVAQRTILAMLAAHAPHEVSTDRLIDAIWCDDLPARPEAALQVQLSRLRRRLPSDAVVTTTSGYRLDIDGDSVDAHLFRKLFDNAVDLMRTTSSAEVEAEAAAAALLERAASLWRGQAFADVGAEWTAPFVAELDAARIRVLEYSFELRLRNDRHGDVISDLERASLDHPLNERFVEYLMLAHSRSGGAPEALRCYREFRRRLALELGLRPSKVLSDLELAILTRDCAVHPTIASEHLSGAPAPVPITSFVGRASELAAALRTVTEHRLVSLLGPGGVGKSRLATELFGSIDRLRPQRAWFIALADLVNPELVPARVASVLDIDVTGGRDPIDAVIQVLRDWSCTLFLDNCENVIEASATLTYRVLSECSGVSVVATSREPLRLAGEKRIRLEGLAVGDASSIGDAELLFLARVDLDLHGAFESSAVRDLCRALDGWPLAIELVAANIGEGSLDRIIGEIRSQVQALESPFRFVAPRHSSLMATLDWSYRLLPEHLQVVYRLLGSFEGRITTRSAAAVLDLDPILVCEQIEALADRSLLTSIGCDTTDVRMLRPVVEHARALLAGNSREHDAVIERYLDHFVEVVCDAESQFDGAEAASVLAELAADESNVTRAVDVALPSGRFESAATLLKTMAYFWLIESMQPVGRAWIDVFVDRDDVEISHEMRVDLLQAAGFLSGSTGDYHAASRRFESCRSLQEARDDPAIVVTINNICNVIEQRLRFREALELLDRADVRAPAYFATTTRERSLTTEWGLALKRSELLVHIGQFDLAIESAVRALDVARRSSSAFHDVFALHDLAVAEMSRGLLDESDGHLVRAHEVAVSLDRYMLREVLTARTRLALLQGDLESAERWNEESMRVGADHEMLALTNGLVWRAEIESRTANLDSCQATLRRALELAIDGEFGIPAVALLHQCVSLLSASERTESAGIVLAMVATIHAETGVVAPAGLTIEHHVASPGIDTEQPLTFLDACRRALDRIGHI